MKQNKAPLVATMFIITAAETLYAGRPLTIADAEPVEKGHLEAEAGAYYEYNCDCKHWDIPVGVAVGIMPSLEMSAGLGGQLEERTETTEKDTETDFSDAVIAAKWLIIEKCPLGNRHAITPSVKIPVADEEKEMGSGKTDYDATWIISREITEKISAHINAGYSWVGGPEKDIIHYGIAVDWQTTESLQLVAEVFADKSRDNKIDTAAMINAGVRWAWNEVVTLDISAGTGITGETSDITATTGLTTAF